MRFAVLKQITFLHGSIQYPAGHNAQVWDVVTLKDNAVSPDCFTANWLYYQH